MTFLGLLVRSRIVVRPRSHEDLGADPVVAQVGREAEALVRLDRVQALVLEVVGAELVHEADAPPLLAHVDDDAAPLLVDPLQGRLELVAAVAAQRPEDVAGQALGVDADEDVLLPGDVPSDQGDVLAVVERARVADDRGSPRSGSGGSATATRSTRRSWRCR